MLTRYSCKDMGLNCPFVVKAETPQEVARMAMEHVLEKHRIDFNNIHSPEELEQMEQALTRSTRVVVE